MYFFLIAKLYILKISDLDILKSFCLSIKKADTIIKGVDLGKWKLVINLSTAVKVYPG